MRNTRQRVIATAHYCRRLVFLILLLSQFGSIATRGAQANESDFAQASVELSGVNSDTCVVLLHGLARTAVSMKELGEALLAEAYRVANVDYPSRFHRIEVLSEAAVSAGIDACREAGSHRIHIVTHSLGGILVRDYLSRHSVPALHRVVMLAPPNHGSAVVDKLISVPGISYMNGPAFEQLSIEEGRSVPLQLGPASVDTAIIAGSRSINLILSTFLENPDDGKVSVSSARLEGMCAMLVLKVSHPFIMKDEETIEQTLHYLRTGQFTLAQAEYPECDYRAVH